MQEEELTRQKELQYLNQRIKEISEKEAKILAEEARTIVEFVENKIKMLKACYGKSDATVKESINRLIRSSQLQSFMAEAETEKTKLGKMMYSERRIKDHINDGLLDEPRVLEFYSFYFGRYRLFFRCFEREFLESENIDESFLDDVFSPKEGDYYVSGERLEIAGATIIDEEFIQKVRTGRHFTETEFYGAKQTYFCQWYGIIHEYDVVRNGYDALKNIIIDSFIEEKHEKVTAIIYGSGGSGKSTVLRRTAVDLHKQSIHIVWVEDDSIEEFVEKGFPAIKNEVEKNENQKFLIIIEDWYRTFKKNNEQLGTDVLKKAKHINNIRFVIGDRTIKKLYTDHRNNDFELHLSSDDNKKIIEKIVEKYPNWKLASEKLLGKDKDKNYKSSLFLLLFILARIDQKEFNNTSLNLAEPQQVFQKIVESDLIFIENKYVGLAKALYYWGCFYSEKKISISYKAFLQIADYFNGDEKITKFFSYWDSSDNKTLNKLKQYITKDGDGLIQFNHDILAEGFGKIYHSDWEEFGYEVKIQLLDVITEKGDDYSASQFLNLIYYYIKSNNDQQKEYEEIILPYVNKLIEKGNQHFDYLIPFCNRRFNEDEYKEYSLMLSNNSIYYDGFWTKFLINSKNEKLKEFFMSDFLKYEKIALFHHEIIETSIRLSKNKDAKQLLFVKILTNPNWKQTHPDILCRALGNIDKKHTTLQQQCILEVLQKGVYRCQLSAYVLSTMLYCIKDENTRQVFIADIFSQDQWKEDKNIHLIETCIRFNNDAEIFKKIIQEFSIPEKWGRTNDSIIINLLFHAKNKNFAFLLLLNWRNGVSYTVISYILKYQIFNTKTKERFYKDVLENIHTANVDADFYCDDGIYNEALTFFNDKSTLKQEYIRKFFSYHDWKDYDFRSRKRKVALACLKHNQDISIALDMINELKKDNQYKNTDVELIVPILKLSKDKSFALHILENHEQSDSFLFDILECFAGETKLPDTINNKIEEIIQDYIDDKNNSFSKQIYSYSRLMRLNFYTHPLWKKEAEKIIFNYIQIGKDPFMRPLIGDILYSYRSFPDKIKEVSEYILTNWRKQITEQEYILILAFGHPQLRSFSKQIATDIIFSDEYQQGRIKEQTIGIINDIFYGSIFPDWKI